MHMLRVQNVPNLHVKSAQGEKDRLMIGLPQTRSTKALSGCIVWPTIVVRKKKNDAVWDSNTWDYETHVQTETDGTSIKIN